VNIGIAETLLGNIDAVHGIKGKNRLWFCSPCRKERIIRRDGCRALLMEGLLGAGIEEGSELSSAPPVPTCREREYRSSLAILPAVPQSRLLDADC
jgi:hypothetical protein